MNTEALRKRCREAAEAAWDDKSPYVEKADDRRPATAQEREAWVSAYEEALFDTRAPFIGSRFEVDISVIRDQSGRHCPYFKVGQLTFQLAGYESEQAAKAHADMLTNAFVRLFQPITRVRKENAELKNMNSLQDRLLAEARGTLRSCLIPAPPPLDENVNGLMELVGRVKETVRDLRSRLRARTSAQPQPMPDPTSPVSRLELLRMPSPMEVVTDGLDQPPALLIDNTFDIRFDRCRYEAEPAVGPRGLISPTAMQSIERQAARQVAQHIIERRLFETIVAPTPYLGRRRVRIECLLPATIPAPAVVDILSTNEDNDNSVPS